MVVREHDGGRPVAHAELGAHGTHMGLDGGLLDAVGGAEDAGRAGAHDRLVVDDDDPDQGTNPSRPAGVSGSRASTRQPSQVGPASNSPPTALARSRIPTNP